MFKYITVEDFNKATRDCLDGNLIGKLHENTVSSLIGLHKDLLHEIKEITVPAISIGLDFGKNKITYIEMATVKQIIEKYSFMEGQIYVTKHDLMLFLNNLLGKQKILKI